MSKVIVMFKIKEILRLHYELELSQHDIAKILKVSSGSVNAYMNKFINAGHHWPVNDEVLQFV